MKQFDFNTLIRAGIALLICLIIIKAVMKLVKKIVARDNINNTIGVFIQSAVRVVLWFLTGLVTADILGIPITSFLAAFSVVGLAVSLSVQNYLSNIAGGLTILATKPFAEGDFIEADSVSGSVEQIGLFYTRIRTVDSKRIHIPNSDMSQSKIINYTAEDYRRIDIEVSASYDAEVGFVEQVLKKLTENTPGILKESPFPSERAVFTNVLRYDSSAIVYLIRAWVKTPDYWSAYFSLMSSLKQEFDKNGIEMTYNHLNVHMIDDKKASRAYKS